MLGLTEEPFRGNEAKYYYLPVVTDAYEALLKSLPDNSCLSLVVGDSGCGKTALLKYLSENSINEWRIVCLTLNPSVDSDNILEQLLGHFHVVVNKNIDQGLYRQQMLSALSQRLNELAMFKLTPIVLIDNAECLNNQSLGTIFDLNELNQDERGSLKIVLLGQPEVVDIVKQPQFADQHSILKIIALENLKREQLVDYLQHRLQIAGFKHKFPFTSGQIDEIYAQCSGNPAQINELADTLLMKKTKDYSTQMETVELEKEAPIKKEFKKVEEGQMAYPGNESKSENDIDELAFSIQKQINSFDEVQNLSEETEDISKDDLAKQLEKELAESQQFLHAGDGNYSFLTPKFLIPGVAGLFIFISAATYFLLSEDSQEIQGTEGETVSQPLALPERNVKPSEQTLEQKSVELKTEIQEQQNPGFENPGFQNNESRDAEGQNIVAKNSKDEQKQLSSDREIKKIPLIYLDDDVLEIVDAEKSGRITSIDKPVPGVKKREESGLVESIENDKKIEELLPKSDQAMAVEFAHDSNNQTKTEVVKETASITSAKLAPRITGISPTPIIGSNRRQAIAINGKNFNQETQIILNWDVNGKKKEKVFSVRLTPSQFKYENNTQLRLFVNTGTDAGKWQLQAVSLDNAHSEIFDFDVVKPFKKQVPESEKVDLPVKKKPQVNNFIAAQPDNFYTIQLLSSSNLTAIKDLRKKHKISEKSSIIPIKKDGKQLYSLVYGSFKNKKVAAADYKKLSRELNKNRLWVRNVGEVKGLLDKSPKSNSTKQNQAKEIHRSSLKNEKFIVTQNPKLWTFQLISLGSVSDMRQYIKNNKIEKGSHFFKRTVNGKTRYTLIFGVYKSRKEAQQQLTSLPKNIRVGKPWIRQYADIQALMKN